MKISNTFYIVSLASFISLPFVSLGHAASDSFCHSYANQAAAQHHENIRLGCGFQGLRWNDNKPAAFIYCKVAGKGSSNNETNQRENSLNQCRIANQTQEPAVGEQGQDFTDGSADNENSGTTEVLHGSNTQVIQGIVDPGVVIPAGSKGAGRDCKTPVSAEAVANSRQQAQKSSKALWHIAAKAKYGIKHSSFDDSTKASYTCKQVGNKHTCVAKGQPCDNVPEINANTQEENTTTSVCQKKSHTHAQWYSGDETLPIWYTWVKTNWEYKAGEKYGYKYARIDDAKNPYVTCKKTKTGYKCSASGTPCKIEGKVEPTCYPQFTMASKKSDGRSYKWLKQEWSKRVRILYGSHYSNFSVANDREEKEAHRIADSFWDVVISGNPENLRYVTARPCRRN